MAKRELVVEVRDQDDHTTIAASGAGRVVLAPVVGDDYWRFRVRLTDRQALLGFPKFSTIGIGFAVEEAWNTNLPYDQHPENILAHIHSNRLDADEGDVLEAIRLIREAVVASGAQPRRCRNCRAVGHFTEACPMPHDEWACAACLVHKEEAACYPSPPARIPYVGDGADGCRRSAQIDREEADGLDRSDPRYDELLASARRWERQASGEEGS